MAAHTWPETLPTSADAHSYSEASGVLTLVTPMDMGPAKMRYRGTRPRTMNVDFIMDNTQIATLETFIITTIRGTARFNFIHPRTQVSIEVRIVPASDGKYFDISHFASDLYKISLSLEQMP